MIRKSAEVAAELALCNKEAFELRLRSASAIKTTKIQKSQASDVSHYSIYGDVLPLPSGAEALRFNDAVTEHALREYVLGGDDPLKVTFLAAKLVEQTFYLFFDPVQPEQPIKNLSVAKHFGTFFTPFDVATTMAATLTPAATRSILLDPCVGSGVLLCAPLLTGRPDQYSTLIGLELDSKLALWSRLIVQRVAHLTGFKGAIDIRQGDGLDYLIALPDNFPPETCDIIINPPYGRMRVTADRATNAETAFSASATVNNAHVKRLQSQVANHARSIRARAEFLGQESGVLEHSRVFFRACGENAAKGARVAIITPDSWLCGSEGASLRRFLLENSLIDRIFLIREDGKKFSTVNQSTAITSLNAKAKTGITISTLAQDGEDTGFIPYAELMNNDKRQMAIPRIAGEELALYRKLHCLPHFSDIAWLTNARGEVDQTLQKELFTTGRTTAKLVRGEHLGRYCFRHESTEDKPSYLNVRGLKSYLDGKPKAKDFLEWRVAGRQCSYAQQKRRLIFALVPPKHALGNSCNYLIARGPAELQEERRYLLLGLLNSAVLDWYFSAVNSNNHVGNYEIDAFPFPQHEAWYAPIASTAMQCEIAATTRQTGRLPWLQSLLEAAVGLAYGLDPDTELKLVLNRVSGCDVSRAVNYAIQFGRGVRFPEGKEKVGAFNHDSPSLSQLDRTIISHVPEGGNWQSIPESVPSKRLEQIREMTAVRGVVRTTYYGRLRRDQPAYTINTYFNRPGNGTHIHPTLDRTLTSREAARLQSFPDSYIFTGSEGAIRDQIGNAVPPLLARAVGSKLFPFHASGLCVDVFCGGGGLSLGLESAGWHVLAAVDYNRDALDTYSLNRPCAVEPEQPVKECTAVYRRDLHDRTAFEDVVARIEAGLSGKPLDLLIGGPPCQGFSHAGFRLHDDKRNDLASIYLHFAERLRPRIFVLENVEGLATFKQGQVLRDIGRTLRDLGYRVVEPVWRLNAEQYGVPQMRRRVFVVATLDPDVDLAPPTPTHEKCAGRREDKRASLFEPVLLPPETVAVALAGLSLPKAERSSDLTRWLEGESSLDV